jgi:UDP-N-acetylmuramate--alanine ligase
MDDYAHHPKEITAMISSVREVYPNKKLTGIFQPHLYSRTRDFAMQFAKSLSMLDEIILLDIYPAREKPIPGITSDTILSKIKSVDKTIMSKKGLLDYLEENKPEFLLTMGAGDIGLLRKEIEKVLLKA